VSVILSYQDELFQFAKFRHVLFHVSGAETMVGRRTVVHEFPMRDFPYPEDMGKKAAEFVVDGFLIGDDYLWQMADLISALNEPGPGTLVHPSLGTLQVSLAQPGKLRESFIERRGMVTFSLTFVESIDITQPSLSVDSQQAVEDAADDAYAPVEDDFASEFDTDNAPAWEKHRWSMKLIISMRWWVKFVMRFDLIFHLFPR
jgi:prophage DNA circulation protein